MKVPCGAVVVATWAVAVFAAAGGGCGGHSGDCSKRDSGADGSSGGNGGEGSDAGVGFILVEASLTNCASLTPISVSPDNGGSFELSSSVFDAPDNGAAPTLHWTASSGTFSDPESSSTTFTCGSPGSVTVTLTLSSPGCDQNASDTLVCM